MVVGSRWEPSRRQLPHDGVRRKSRVMSLLWGRGRSFKEQSGVWLNMG